MKKNAFTIIEVTVVFLLILAVAFFVIPKSLDTTKQARFISKWTDKYSQLEYMYSVVKAQRIDVSEEKAFPKKETLLDIIKPYLRVTSEIKSLNYKQYYMNKLPVVVGDKYAFDEFYLTSSNEIIGLKGKNNHECKGQEICTSMSFDLNGEAKPNTWGYDIFGINVYKDRIEPIGKGLGADVLKSDCSGKGFGVYCSYYYLIGGKFD